MAKQIKTKAKPKLKIKEIKRPNDSEIINKIKNILKSDSHCVLAFNTAPVKKGIKMADGMLVRKSISSADIIKVAIQQLEVDPIIVAVGLVTGKIQGNPNHPSVTSVRLNINKMSWRKITTSKYVVYPTGQVYRDGKFFRTLTGWQNDYVMSAHWRSKKEKDRLDSLIDENFENLKMEIPK